MKKQIILIISSLIAISCISQKKEIISKSTIKLEGGNTNIRDLIEIDGYYQDQDYSSHKMFFEDGMYVSSFSFKKDIPENEIKANMSKSLAGGIEDKQFSWGNYWGVYKIEGDTIVVYYYLRGSFWTPWYFDEVRYKIIDRTAIQQIYRKGLRKADEQDYKDSDKSPWIKNGDKLYFNSADSLPSSDCWLKEEKWIWRNESDWKSYMEKIKQKKKEYRKK
jgi:hypothetical protein